MQIRERIEERRIKVLRLSRQEFDALPLGRPKVVKAGDKWRGTEAWTPIYEAVVQVEPYNEGSSKLAIYQYEAELYEEAAEIASLRDTLIRIRDLSRSFAEDNMAKIKELALAAVGGWFDGDMSKVEPVEVLEQKKKAPEVIIEPKKGKS